MSYSNQQEEHDEFVNGVGEHLPTWAWYDGQGCTGPWLLHPCDVWVANPHYRGPAVPHPEDDAAWEAEAEQADFWTAGDGEVLS